MTLTELYTMLTGITGFADKVAYRAFPMGSAPALPFITYYVQNSDNFMADGKVYLQKNLVSVELYTNNKDTASEALVEAKFDEYCIPWQKYEEYIESEHMYQIAYDITI